MSLIRGIDQSPTKKRVVLSLVGLCRDLGITVIAEGIETLAERKAILAVGADALQGYHLGRPGPPFPAHVW
jgi:EAL domain-containing protein (putative c-di-GMP-specific phosphodiesterase class I)